MSKDVDRNQVLKTTKVRTALKNDVSWIQKSKEKMEEQHTARTEQVVETKPVPVRQNASVLSTARKFNDLANQANGADIPPRKDAQPEGSTVETTDDTKPQAPINEHIKYVKAQPEKSVTNTPAKIKEEYADTAVHWSDMKHNEGAAEVSADVQPVSSTKKNPECPVDPAEQPVANTTAKNKQEYTKTADQSNEKHNEDKVPAGAHEDLVAETSAVAGIEESRDTADVHSALAVELKPQEEPLTKTESADIKSPVQPAEGNLPKQAAEEIVEAVAEVVVMSLPDKSDAINTTPGEEAAVQDRVKPVPGLLAESVSKLSSQTAAKTATEGSCVRSPPEQAAVAKVAVESLPETPTVTDALREEVALQDRVEPVPGLLAESLSESPTQPAADTATEGSCEKGPPELAAGKTVSAVSEVAAESSSETHAVTDASGEEAALQDRVEPVPGLLAESVSESPTQPAAETAVKSVECKLVSAASAEPVLKTRAVVVECEVQPVDNTVVMQSIEPIPRTAAGRMEELNINDAVEPVTATDAEAAQDEELHRAIELTDAIDVAPPTAEADPEPLKDPKQSFTMETKLNQQSDITNISEMFQKPVEELKSPQTRNETRHGKDVCSFCDKIIEGYVKIRFSEPLVQCHPDCLKCGVCAKALGDMLTPMFLLNQVIQCDGCFAKALKT